MINRAGLKKNPAVCHLQKTHFRHRETKRLKGKDGAICHRNNRPKKTRLMWEYQTKQTLELFARDKGHSMLIKEKCKNYKYS